MAPQIRHREEKQALCRVNYSDALWTRLHTAAVIADPAGPAYIPSIDFAGLLVDSHALAAAGQISYLPFLTFIPALASRAGTALDQGPPWAAFQALAPIQSALTGACRAQYVALVGAVVGAAVNANALSLDTVGEGDAADVRVLRASLAAAAAAAEASGRGSQYTLRVVEFLGGGADDGVLHIDVRQSVFTLAIAEAVGDVNDAWELLQIYFSTLTVDSTGRRATLAALASVSEPALIQRALEEVGFSGNVCSCSHFKALLRLLRRARLNTRWPGHANI